MVPFHRNTNKLAWEINHVASLQKQYLVVKSLEVHECPLIAISGHSQSLLSVRLSFNCQFVPGPFAKTLAGKVVSFESVVSDDFANECWKLEKGFFQYRDNVSLAPSKAKLAAGMRA